MEPTTSLHVTLQPHHHPTPVPPPPAPCSWPFLDHRSTGGGHEREINGRLPGAGVVNPSWHQSLHASPQLSPPRCTHRTTRCDLPPAPRTHGGAAGPIAAQPQEAPLLYLSLAVSESSTLLHINCSLCQEDRAINLVFAAPFTCPTNACLAVKLHC